MCVLISHFSPDVLDGPTTKRTVTFWGRTMDRTKISEPTGFSELSKMEQIRYLQALWDRIAERPDEIPVPESHIQLAEQRLDEYRRDPSQGRSAHSVFDRLQKKDR